MNTSRGFSTLELLLALMIMSTTLSAVLVATIGAPATLADGMNYKNAIIAAQTIMKEGISSGETNFASLSSIATTTLDGYQVSLFVLPLSDGRSKLLTANAAWTDTEGRFSNVSISGISANLSSAADPSACNSLLMGDWSHPLSRTLSLSAGSLLPMNSGANAHPITSLLVSSSTLIASVSTSVSRSDPTMLIFDISSTTQPTFIGSVDNATTTKGGVAQMAAAGGHLYAANAVTPNFSTCKVGSSCSQLQIFDDTNAAAPILIENYQLATTTQPFATGSSGQANGRSIVYSNGYAYLGLTKTASAQGDEFNIIDVHDPLHPTWIGGYHVGRSVNRILIEGATAYIATDDPSDELLALDISNPSQIRLEAQYNAPGYSGFGYGKDIIEDNGFLVLGRTYVPNGPEIAILSHPSSTPTLIGSESFTGANATSTEALLMRDFLAYAITGTSLQFFSLSDPTHPTQYAPSIPFVSSTGTAIACSRNTLYAASVNEATNAGYLTTITAS